MFERKGWGDVRKRLRRCSRGKDRKGKCSHGKEMFERKGWGDV